MSRKFAVIFDMDGVLVDNSSFHVRAWNLFLKSQGVSFNDDMRKKVFGATNREHLEIFFKRKLTDKEVLLFEEIKEQIYRDIYKPEIKPVKGLISFLELLAENKIPIALATAAPKVNIDFVLENTGTSKFFSKIFNASSVTIGKPNPEIYLKAIASLKIPPSNCIVIEDSINGILAAKAAGAKVIGLTTTHPSVELPPVNFMINDFEHLTVLVLKKLL